MVLARILHLAADCPKILKSVVGGHDGNKRCHERGYCPTIRGRDESCLACHSPACRYSENQNRGYGRYLQSGQKHLNPAHSSNTQVVKGCNQHNDTCRQRLCSTENKLVRLRLKWNVKVPGKNRRSHGRSKKSHKAQEPGGDHGSRTRPHYHGTGPAKKKSPQWANSATQVNVVATRFRHGSAQFGVAKGPEKDDHSADNPDHQNLPHRIDFTGHVASHEKHRLSNHGANHDRCGSPQAKTPYESSCLLELV